MPSLFRAVAAALMSASLMAVAVSAVNDNNQEPVASKNGIAAAVGTIQEQDQKQATFISLPLVPHHVERRRRERVLHEAIDELTEDEEERQYHRRETAQQVGALYQGYGTHYIDLWCGSPPQRQTVIVDTGSSVTAFPCEGCKDCGVPDYHIDALFEQSRSTSFQTRSCQEQGCTSARSHCDSSDECHISMSYAEGSRWDAFEGADLCYVGGSHVMPLVKDAGTDSIDPKHASHFAFEMVFGCQTRITGLFKTQLADGIMGMSNNKGTYWYQMFKAGMMGADRQFSLCFSRQPTADREGTEAGAMTMGGVDPRLHHDDMVYTTNADGGRAGFFSVKIRNVYMRDGKAGESAKSALDDPTEGVSKLEVTEQMLNSGGVIVDSGTTDTYWNRNIATAFKKKYKEMTGTTYANKAMTLSKEDLKAMPTILFQIYGENQASDPYSELGLAGHLDPDHPFDVLLAFPPSHYMEFDPTTKRYTPRFYPTENGGSVLGANAMMGHDVFFDVDGNRIGFAESDCDLSQILSDVGYKSLFDPSINETITKKPPSGSKSTTDDIQNVLTTCDSTCRGSIVAVVLVLMFLGVCISKTMCGNSSSGGGGIASSNNMEMSDTFSTYKDTPTEGFTDEDIPEDEFDGDYS